MNVDHIKTTLWCRVGAIHAHAHTQNTVQAEWNYSCV